MAMIPSMAEETNASSSGANKACSDGRSREDEYGDGKGTRTRNGNAFKKRPLCNGSGQGEELLRLWGIWAFGPSL